MRSLWHNQCIYFALKNRISTEAGMWLLSCSCLRVTDALPMCSFVSISPCKDSNATVMRIYKRSHYITLNKGIIVLLLLSAFRNTISTHYLHTHTFLHPNKTIHSLDALNNTCWLIVGILYPGNI